MGGMCDEVVGAGAEQAEAQGGAGSESGNVIGPVAAGLSGIESLLST